MIEDFKDIILSSSNVDVKSLTKEEFADMIFNDMKSAVNKYYKLLNENCEITSKKLSYNFTIHYFDFDPSFGQENSTWSFNVDCNKERFIKLYDNLSENEYRKKFLDNAKGWEFHCTIDYRNYLISKYSIIGRPEIKFILPDELNDEIEDNQDKLSEAIREFYKGCKYWGD